MSNPVCLPEKLISKHEPLKSEHEICRPTPGIEPQLLRQTVPVGAHCVSAHWATEAGLLLFLWLLLFTLGNHDVYCECDYWLLLLIILLLLLVWLFTEGFAFLSFECDRLSRGAHGKIFLLSRLERRQFVTLGIFVMKHWRVLKLCLKLSSFLLFLGWYCADVFVSSGQ